MNPSTNVPPGNRGERDTIRPPVSVYAAMLFTLFLAYPVGTHDAHAHLPPSPSSPPHRIAVFTPTSEGNTYWPEVHRFMIAAAADLGLELVIHEFDVRDRFSKPEEGVPVLRSEPVPDGAIFSVAFGQARPLVDAAEELGIPFFLSGPLFPAELEELGGSPRGTYRNWIGYFSEDEAEKGYLLARKLVGAALEAGRTSRDGTVHVVGVGGDTTWFGSALREQGLRRAIAEEPSAQLLQTVSTRWTPAEGRNMTARLLQRYAEVSAVWAASDQLALGAADALRSHGMTPGRTVFTGGLDLSLLGLESVSEGTLTATVASTPLAWVEILVYLHDYLHGMDFAEQVGTEITFDVHVADRASAERYMELRGWFDRIDYRRFSRYHNSDLKTYDFGIEQLQLQPNTRRAEGQR